MSVVVLSVCVAAFPPQVGVSSDPWSSVVSVVSNPSVPTVAEVIYVDGAYRWWFRPCYRLIAPCFLSCQFIPSVFSRSLCRRASIELVPSPELRTSSFFDLVKFREVCDLYDIEGVETVAGLSKCLILLLHDLGHNHQHVVELEAEVVSVRTDLRACSSYFSSSEASHKA